MDHGFLHKGASAEHRPIAFRHFNNKDCTYMPQQMRQSQGQEGNSELAGLQTLLQAYRRLPLEHVLTSRSRYLMG